MSTRVLVKKLFCDAKLPVRANPTDSGADVFIYRFEKLYTKTSVCSKDVQHLKSVELCTNDRVLVNTGLSIAVSPGYEIQVRPRSGNAINKGLIVVNSPGTIDAGYRGMIGVIIANIGHSPQILNVGDKIAQLVVMKVELSPYILVEELDESERGERGFGSTDN